MDFAEDTFVHRKALARLFHKVPLLATFLGLGCAGTIFWLFLQMRSLFPLPLRIGCFFIPIFMDFIILFFLGIFLSLSFVEERGGNHCWKEILKKTFSRVMEVSYLLLCPLLGFLLIWVLLAVFSSMAEMPVIGRYVHATLFFIPFFLIIASVALAAASLLALFFMVPSLAFSSLEKAYRLNSILRGIRFMPLFLGLLPSLGVGGFLWVVSFLSRIYFSQSASGALLAGEQLILMLACSFCLTPFVVFFFHVAFSSYLLRKK